VVCFKITPIPSWQGYQLMPIQEPPNTLLTTLSTHTHIARRAMANLQIFLT